MNASCMVMYISHVSHNKLHIITDYRKYYFNLKCYILFEKFIYLFHPIVNNYILKEL